jgi:predicted metal-dependent HD superfamily phosphohydrolase
VASVEVEQLRGRWHALWSALGAQTIPEQVFDHVVDAYEEPHRAYHRLEHVIDCLRIFDSAKSDADHPSEVEAGIWFHDAVYDPARGDNEHRSADWASQVLRNAGIDAATSERIERLIVSTSHDNPAALRDARLLVDIDLSILGSNPSKFLAYEEQIRREYAWVPDHVFHARRADLLEGFLARKPLYLTPGLRRRFESQARINLAEAIERHRMACAG